MNARGLLLAAGVAIGGLAFVAPAAWAEAVSITAELSGQNESPPNDSTGSGAAEATFDTETMELTWSVTFDGLTGPLIGAHIHGPADPGENAGIVIPLETLESPIEGSATLTQTQADELLAGKYYFNLHTEAHPGGEIRGQLQGQ